MGEEKTKKLEEETLLNIDRVKSADIARWNVQFCSQQLKSTIFILKLGPLFSAKYTNSGWFVEKINSCFHLINILSCINNPSIREAGM